MDKDRTSDKFSDDNEIGTLSHRSSVNHWKQIHSFKIKNIPAQKSHSTDLPPTVEKCPWNSSKLLFSHSVVKKLLKSYKWNNKNFLSSFKLCKQLSEGKNSIFLKQMTKVHFDIMGADSRPQHCIHLTPRRMCRNFPLKWKGQLSK